MACHLRLGLTDGSTGGTLLGVIRPKVRRKSASVDTARGRELRRATKLSALERVVKALALGRRGRLLRVMAAPGLRSVR